MKKFELYVVVFVFSIILVPSANAARIDFDTISSVEAQYSLLILDDTELDSLYSLAVGEIIDLSGLGSLFTGTYYVSSVQHSFSPDGYSTSFTLDRQEGMLVQDDGNTDVNFILLGYTVSIFDIQNPIDRITGFTFTPVPEPFSGLLFMTGLVMLLLLQRRLLIKIP